MKYRISTPTKYLMLGTALFIDILEGLLSALAIGLVASWLTWVVSWMIFPLWFTMKGASYTKNKKLMKKSLIGAGVGLIPILNALPELTITIWLNIRDVRKEDEENMKKEAKIYQMRQFKKAT